MEEQYQKNKKRNIAIIGSRGYPVVYSGFETLVKELAEGLINQGFDVTVYCHSHFFEDKPQNVNGWSGSISSGRSWPRKTKSTIALPQCALAATPRSKANWSLLKQ